MAETEIKKINGMTLCDDTARHAAKKAQDTADAIVVPTKNSELENDSNYIKKSETYAKSEVYTKSETYSKTEVDNFINTLSTWINTIADSDDVTLDQMSEIVAYIKDNRDLIDSITTSKVSVSDIIDNLTTSAPNKPLSAKQGAVLKALIDNVAIPDALPNPHPIVFTGAVNDTYDGSVKKTIEIPERDSTAVHYTPQELTADEQKQTRRNIDAQKQVYAVSTGNPWNADDCINAPVRGLKLYGASKQKQYAGKNLLKINGREIVKNLTANKDSIISLNDNMLIQGIAHSGYIAINTTVIDSVSHNNISFHTTSVPNGAGYGIGIVMPYIHSQNLIFSAEYEGSYKLDISLYDEQSKQLSSQAITNKKPFTLNIENASYMIIVISIGKINTSLTISNPQLEIGAMATPYEPYVGGMPSPNPDYPQEVRCNDLTYTLTNNAGYNGGSATAPELYAIGDVRDEWDAVTGHGIRRIKQKILTGDEYWRLEYSSDSKIEMFINVIGKKLGYFNILCNSFLIGTSAVLPVNSIYGRDDNSAISVCTNIVKSLDEWKSYLMSRYNSGNPIILYYEIQNIENFTATPSQLTTPDGYAQMLPSGDGVAGDVEMEYAVDIEKRYVPKTNFDNFLISQTSPIMRRNIYRGKDLGTEVTAAQKAAIQSGTFDDLFIGDFWTRNGKKYFIADMDFWYNMGDTAFTKHHLVMIPEGQMYSAKMNKTNTTAGGYVGSLMYTEGLNQAKETINAAFGDMVLTHREYLTNAVSNHYTSAGAWYDSSVELMNEIMVYGSNIFGNVANGGAVPCNYTIDKQQLALFRLNPKALNKRQNIWLRDVVSSTYFAYVYSYGYANYNYASTSYGVRPVFPLG